MKKPSPDKTYGPILADLFHKLCKEIHKEIGADGVRVSAEFMYRDAKGALTMKIFAAPAGETERLLEGEARPAHEVHGPLLIEQLNKFCVLVFSETKASGIRVACEFVFKNGKGDLKMKNFITPDGTTERMLDTEVLMPRGAKLQHDAQVAMRKAFILINGCDSL